MPTSIYSVIDIPHILTLIAGDLRPNELQSCILVNKAFHLAFIPKLYHRLVLSNPLLTEERLDAATRGIELHGKHIRDLVFRFRCNDDWSAAQVQAHSQLLDALTQSCLSLCSLEVTISSISTSATCLPFVHRQASTLRNLSLVIDTVYAVALQTSWLLSVIGPCTGLVDVDISAWAETTIGLDAAIQIGERLPYLERLALQLTTVAKMPQPFNTTASSFDKACFPWLKELIVKDWEQDPMLQNLSLLVRECPRLTSIDFQLQSGQESTSNILSALKDSCPNLSSMSIGGMPLQEPPSFHSPPEARNISGGPTQELAAMVTGIAESHPRLQELVLSHFSLPKTVLAKVAHGFSFSLHSLVVVCATSVSAEGLSLILTQCPCLEELGVHIATRISNPLHAIVDCRALLQAPWVCRNLRSLMCPIGWPAIRTTRQKLQSSEEFCAVERQFYGQLSRLPCLQVLRVSMPARHLSRWSIQGDEQAIGFRWGLDYGLDQLATLSALRFLSFARHEPHSVGINELLWMKQHWPRLRSLNCSDTNELADWMKANWPQVEYICY